jgi:hypothetical protein
MRKTSKYLLRKPQRKDRYADVYGRIILKWSLEVPYVNWINQFKNRAQC